jgi:hypothetical protein
LQRTWTFSTLKRNCLSKVPLGEDVDVIWQTCSERRCYQSTSTRSRRQPWGKPVIVSYTVGEFFCPT